MWTGIPVFKLTEAETQKLLRMEEELHKRVIGQEQAIAAVSRAIRRARAGIKDPKRPSGSFIFLGPSGVGKTELARTLAEFLFGDESALIQVDMSEYMEKHAVSRLVGSPPGYIGYDEGGQLTEQVRRKPYSVILLDEVEKAHPEVFNILLQILEDGRLTDAQGRSVDFRNAILIMTSNIGAATISRNTPLGFSVADETGLSYDDMKSRIMGELKRVFRPELINRIDEIIVFHKLTKEEITQIVDLLLVRLQNQMKEHGLALRLTDEAKDLLVEQGYDPTMGARPLRRAIQRLIEDPLSDRLLSGGFPEGGSVTVDRDGEEMKLIVHEAEPQPETVGAAAGASVRGARPRHRASRNPRPRDSAWRRRAPGWSIRVGPAERRPHGGSGDVRPAVSGARWPRRPRRAAARGARAARPACPTVTRLSELVDDAARAPGDGHRRARPGAGRRAGPRVARAARRRARHRQEHAGAPGPGGPRRPPAPRVMLVTGEESPIQVRGRAERLDADCGPIQVLAETRLESVLAAIEAHRPRRLRDRLGADAPLRRRRGRAGRAQPGARGHRRAHARRQGARRHRSCWSGR